MNVGILVVLAIFMGGMLMVVQRTPRKHRLLVVLVLLVPAELIRRYVWFRGLHGEAWVALTIALVFNLMFWWLIGRYNPVARNGEIQVIGLDD